MTKGADATWFGVNLGPATFNNTLAVQLALMGFAEVRADKSRDNLRVVPRRPPIPLPLSVGRAGSYANDAKVWNLSLVQGPFSVAPCQTLNVHFATLPSLCTCTPLRLQAAWCHSDSQIT
jgi:hypothetical protein